MAETEKKFRYLIQYNKATEMLSNAANLYDYIEGLKYTLSLCLRYRKNFKDIIQKCGQSDKLDKCIKAGILKQWVDTYWFNKDKAASLQEFILEHSN